MNAALDWIENDSAVAQHFARVSESAGRMGGVCAVECSVPYVTIGGAGLGERACLAVANGRTAIPHGGFVDLARGMQHARELVLGDGAQAPHQATEPPLRTKALAAPEIELRRVEQHRRRLHRWQRDREVGRAHRRGGGRGGGGDARRLRVVERARDAHVGVLLARVGVVGAVVYRHQQLASVARGSLVRRGRDLGSTMGARVSAARLARARGARLLGRDRKSTRLNSSH